MHFINPYITICMRLSFAVQPVTRSIPFSVVLKTVEKVSCFEATGVGHTVDATSSCETSLVGLKPRYVHNNSWLWRVQP